MKRSVLTALAAAVVAALSLGVLAAPAGAVFPSTTILSESAASVTYGQESTIVFTADVSGSGTGPGQGTITVSAGLAKSDQCTIDIATTVDTCSIADTALPASSTAYPVTATFGGDTFYNPSTSAPVDLTVNQQPTTTSLSISSPSVTYGQESSLTFTSSVTPSISGTPTGTIDVNAGATLLCPITLPATTCSTTDDPISAAGTPAAITATYLGDTNDATSTSLASDLSVTQASTTTTLSVLPSSVTIGDESALQITATVAPEFGGTPSGTITVDDGTLPLCTVTLPATTCPPLGAGALSAQATPYDITATYSGDTNFIGSASSPEPLTVTMGNSTTSLTITPSTTTYGDESTVTFSATVSSTQSGTPTGTMTLTAGAITLCSFDVTAATSCATTDTALAASSSPYDVVASYSGDTNFNPSASDAPLTVNEATTTTALSGPFTEVYGNEGSITFSPTVSPQFVGSTPTGLVTVATGSTTLCTFTLPAQSGCTAPNTVLPASGSVYPVTATYAGDTNFFSSASSAQDLTVTQASTTTTLSISSPSVTYGNESSLTFTATVTPEYPATPTGTVTVMAGSTPVCTITLPATTCSSTDDPLSAGASQPITADYGGDTNFLSSSSSSHDLTVNQATTSTSLNLSATTVGYGSESTVVFTATVTPSFNGTPTGTVTVATPSTTLCTITLPTPTPTCSTTDDPLAPSTTPYAVTATYGGDGNFIGSASSPAQDLTVTAATTTTTLTPSASSVAYGNEGTVTFTATVTPTASGGPQPTGVVTVGTTTTTLCTFSLPATSCVATNPIALNASSTPYVVTAVYGGGGPYGSSTSPPSDLTVTQASTTTGLSLSLSTVTYGNEQANTFTVTLAPQYAGTPTGTITVATGATSLCTISLPTTNLTCTSAATTLPFSASAYSVTATYAGDTNFTTSNSTAQDLTVNQASTATSLSLTPVSVAYGSESTVLFTVGVSPQYVGSPSGTITVSTPTTTLCTILLPATTCRTTANALVPSGTAYSVTAAYPGDTNFISSTSSASSLTITGGTSTTALSPSSSSVTYGDETTLVFTVTVSPVTSGGAAPTGTATVVEGAKLLCTASVSSGTGTCSPSSDTVLTASTTAYALVATYGGDSNYSPSGSGGANGLTVTKATSTTTLSATPSPVTYGAESAVTFSASSSPEFGGAPSGTITIANGSTPLCTITLPAATCTTGQTALGAGGYTITATYGGDGNFQSSSGTHGLTVNQATPSTPSIANLPSGAAEEGSFVASVATSGDGTRSVVSETTANCTVGSNGVTVTFLVEGNCTLTPQVASGHNFIGVAGSPQTFTILPGPRGYWLVGSDGGIFSFGTAQFYGSMGGTPLQRPVVGITPTPTKNGYWLVASDGGIFAFGDSNFYGSIPGLGLHPAGSGQPNSLDAPIVAMVPSTDGNGYFMVASDGGVFAFGDAKFAGSCPGIGGCAGAAVAVMPDHSGNGYWLVTTAGAIYAFGDAPFFGAPSPQSSPVVSAVATPDGHGYWILYGNGTVLNFGDAAPYGDPAGYVNGYNPATSIFPTTDGLGYWVASARGDVFSYGNAPFLGSMSSTPLNGPIIAAFGF